ncbi:DUF2288 domain-containing protein [Thiopseudomonas denitrificans]|uniref:DUF2288 domain-containing protein n=1 Tax=Thiopseudomonas denitrificans TaxID=1501432 RepID=A0A4V3D5H9_9GAMM|nr:DUF2288 domain-containing protein [Thiopseudomonas denitrificans]TDQ40167.1 hypothetical protein DFQ45_101302 [Thiopseudomonas denitrificans]
MTDSISPLYAEILGETARISWQELAPWFARGQLLWVAADLDLVSVAEAIASDDKQLVSSLMQQNRLHLLTDEQAGDLHQRDPELWATVVRPWVLVQERATDGGFIRH